MAASDAAFTIAKSRSPSSASIRSANSTSGNSATTVVKAAAQKSTTSVELIRPQPKKAKLAAMSAIVDLTSEISTAEVNPDDEASLAKSKKNWRSPIYSLFKVDQVRVEYHNGRLCHFFPCGAPNCKNSAGGVRRYQDTTDKSSSGNLKHHAISCWGHEAVEAVLNGGKAKEPSGSIITAFAQKGQQVVRRVHTDDEVRLRVNLVRWLTESNRPIDVINDRGLRQLLLAGRPNIELPSCSTISQDIHVSFVRCQYRIDKLLRDHPGRLHFATDAWRSPNYRFFIAWTVHLEHDGRMLCFLLDVIEVAEFPNGENMAKVFHAMLERVGLTKKIHAVNMVNMSSNDAQTTKLAALPNSFEACNRVRCFNHTVQLAAKALLRPLNPGMMGKDQENDSTTDTDDDYPPLTLDDETYGAEQDDSEDVDCDEVLTTDDPDDGIDELECLGLLSHKRTMAETVVIRDAVSKIRSLSFATVHSTTKARLWRHYCVKAEIKPNLIPRDVASRWKSTYDMLTFALRYRKPIDKITCDSNLPQVHKCQLSVDEWSVVAELAVVLERYKQATTFFSQDSASIAGVIPAMDKLDNQMKTSEVVGDCFHPSILAVMNLARNKMDRYWKNDSLNVYRIAMVLHPGLKLEYFRTHDWQEEWVEAAERISQEEYILHYKTRTRSQFTEPAATNDPNDFGDYSMGPDIFLDELQDYLRQPITKVKDPLEWWANNRVRYPTLYRMALDYLSVPATSTAVKRVFSQVRELHLNGNQRQFPSSTRAFLCLGSWLRTDLISTDDLVTVVKLSQSRKRKLAEADTDSNVTV